MIYPTRPLTCLDVKSARDIFEEVFHEDEWSEFGWIWRYRSKTQSLGIYNEEGDLLGFALILHHSRKLKYIGICPLFQNLGLGSILLTAVLEICKENRQSLALVPANPKVEIWYRKHGFQLSKYFKASDNTVWSTMIYHSHNTRSQGRVLLDG